jgi:hypothetical protein
VPRCDPAAAVARPLRSGHIEYRDDTSFTADGDFIDGVLHHAGMILCRKGRGSE